MLEQRRSVALNKCSVCFILFFKYSIKKSCDLTPLDLFLQSYVKLLNYVDT